MTLELSRQKAKIIKVIAIVFVIMSHTEVFPCGGAIGVHLFLIVSGYEIYCSLENEQSAYWQKRVKSVYLPYLFCTVIFLFVRYFIYGNISFLTTTVSLLGLDFDCNADPTMWYISCVFACYLIAWVAFELKDKPLIEMVFCAASFGLITLCGYKYIFWHQGMIAWNYGFSFPIVMAFAKYRFIEGRKAKSIKAGLLALSLVITLALISMPHEKFIKLFFTLAFAVFIYTVLTTSFIDETNIFSRILVLIGEKSYFMYLNEALGIGLMKIGRGLVRLPQLSAALYAHV